MAKNSFRYYHQSLEAKSGMCTTVLIENDRRARLMNHRKTRCGDGGIGMVRCVLSCYQGTKPLMRKSTVDKWTN